MITLTLYQSLNLMGNDLRVISLLLALIFKIVLFRKG